MGQNLSATKRCPHVQMNRSEIMRGDHIYTPRGGVFPFDHHGIYIGKDRAIHFQKSVDDHLFGSGSSSGSRECSDCGHHRRKNGVVKSCLGCFLRKGKIYRYEYGYPSPYAGFKMGNAGLMKWSTSFVSDHPETVIDRAKDLLEMRDGFGEYGLIDHNCEDFALYCKTGKRIRSGQVVLACVVPFMIVGCVYRPFALSSINWEDFRFGDDSGNEDFRSGDDSDDENFHFDDDSDNEMTLIMR